VICSLYEIRRNSQTIQSGFSASDRGKAYNICENGGDHIYFISGKAARCETRAVVNKADGKVLCLAFANGNRADLRLFKEGGAYAKSGTVLEVGTGHQGLAKINSK
jgi:hypothetical protein